jgi:hypothetical protein
VGFGDVHACVTISHEASKPDTDFQRVTRSLTKRLPFTPAGIVAFHC